MASLTVKRNAKRVGRNSKSYDEKHPVNPVVLRLIHDAAIDAPRWMRRKLRTMRNWSKPEIARGIREMGSYHHG